ncbi:hypothetical protein R3W88_025864 [Solanum pinnatisectum]|uniref:Uncharacterized protein n=1 Tax=Solanum pinnatisectum TaxID=50273 RepID=A0AAV9M4L3_9SOLN|nr:hypothetical protein R3W88_025864 [Solanum pinnatisectum]
MENLKNDCHVLLVTFPGQGHINPSLQFAKKLVNLGIKVTFSTSLTTFNRISKLPNIEGLSLTPFSDGYDGKFKGLLGEFESFYSSLVSHGSEFVTQIIESRAVEGRPFKRVIYTTLIAWVGIVVRALMPRLHSFGSNPPRSWTFIIIVSLTMLIVSRIVLRIKL